MNTTSWTLVHQDHKIGFSTFVVFVVGVVEIRAMEDLLNGFSDIVYVSVQIDVFEFKFHCNTLAPLR